MAPMDEHKDKPRISFNDSSLAAVSNTNPIISDTPRLSCDSNSHDLSPLVSQCETMIRDRARNGPVVLLLSEVHPVASNVILPLLIMERLQRSSDLKIAFGIERSHDLLDRLTECQTGKTIPTDEMDFKRA